MGAHNKLAPKKQTEDYYLDSYKTNTIVDLDYHDGKTGDLELEIPIDDPSQVILHKEMMLNMSADFRNVRFSCDNIDFGFAE
jgi:hypothetical protein